MTYPPAHTPTPTLSMAEMARRENDAMRRRCGITAPMTCSMFNPNAQAAPGGTAGQSQQKEAVLRYLADGQRRTTSEIAKAIAYPLHRTPALLSKMAAEGRVAKVGRVSLKDRRPVSVWERVQ